MHGEARRDSEPPATAAVAASMSHGSNKAPWFASGSRAWALSCHGHERRKSASALMAPFGAKRTGISAAVSAVFPAACRVCSCVCLCVRVFVRACVRACVPRACVPSAGFFFVAACTTARTHARTHDSTTARYCTSGRRHGQIYRKGKDRYGFLATATDCQNRKCFANQLIAIWWGSCQDAYDHQGPQAWPATA